MAFRYDVLVKERKKERKKETTNKHKTNRNE